ncbi:tRNA glutamyl-Q(34) synthetase GluQRS [Acidovorax sp. D2M1]|uniref:Glutamyl-Q tRNA(Asp) synthetase n=1 Tax=Acidovorax benzenivorans TaxID=2987520 RepID=A0ABT5RUX3_9BURK|nr:tRNA glutamyl-Q(34) synthetase GluQRS [Acidovorax benzenivorans]MDD2177491.1 tRNA glutamyl-Q(34) synthetase GluQRS [Acidovorax benzenivorans]
MTGGVGATPRYEGRYVGRFAPSPTGPLHAGSLVAALASWLDARAHNGRWLVRIEDVDQPRCVPGADAFILQQLAACGLHPDAQPQWQSARSGLYQHALDQLMAQGDAYPCACSRKDIEDAHAAQGHARERHAALPYPGTCRQGLQGRTGRSWRFNVTDFKPKQPSAPVNHALNATYSVADGVLHWRDRRLGHQQQQVATAVGDFVLRRADGLWAYQLAVVVDDADQGITDVVRGEDLADNTPRQILLQQALGLPMPRYLHTPLVCGDNGEKLSKQNGAQPLDLRDPLQALSQAALALGLPAVAHLHHICIADALAQWVAAWRRNYNGPP